MKERDYCFDNLKGIMIFLVVFGHCIGRFFDNSSADSNFIPMLNSFIYSFHMPVFVFISGFFYDPDKDPKYALSNYLVPYIITNTIAQIANEALLSAPLLSVLSINPLSPTWAMWYLLSLFFWNVFTKYVVRLRWSIIVSVMIAIFVGLFSEVGQFMSISRTFTFFPYFLIGHYVRKNQPILTSLKQHKIMISIAFVVMETFVALMSIKGVKGQTYQLHTAYSNINQSMIQGSLLRLITYLAGTVGIAFMISFSSSNKSILSYLGEHSITVYVAHYTMIIAADKIVRGYNNPYVLLTISTLLSAIICILLGNRFIHCLYKSLFGRINKILLTK